MSRSLNQVTLMGNLTRDPELRQTPSGQSVCNFSLAINSSYKDSTGEWKEKTDFINIVAWAKLADNIVQYVTKGRSILITGKLQTQTWEQDGQKRSKTEVVAQDAIFLGGREDNQANQTTSTVRPTPKPDVVIDDISDEPINLDDIPF